MGIAQNKRKIARFGRLTTIVAGFLVLSLPFALGQTAETPPAVSDPITTTPASDPIAELNTQIAEKRKIIEELRQQSGAYQQAVDSSSKQVRDLKSQISTIDGQISDTNFQIQIKQAEIESLELEMESLQHQVDEKNKAITQQKDRLAETIKELDQNTRTPVLSKLLLNSTLSDFYGQAQAVATMNQSLQDALGSLNRLKEELQHRQNDLASKRDEVEQNKLQLQIAKGATIDQKELKVQLLDSAKSNQGQYNELLQQSVREEQQANSTISALEQELQKRLSGGDEKPPEFTSTGYIWPAQGIITAYYRDRTYPFSCRVWKSAYCLEHSGLDVGMPQGTPIRATADGIISVVSDQGFYYNADGKKLRSALNFVGIIHGTGISSRYLHLSSIYAKTDQFVKQGEVIGLSGGLPGTAGAGGITTGAHLHFEVRVDGIPDDPMKYLP